MFFIIKVMYRIIFFIKFFCTYPVGFSQSFLALIFLFSYLSLFILYELSSLIYILWVIFPCLYIPSYLPLFKFSQLSPLSLFISSQLSSLVYIFPVIFPCLYFPSYLPLFLTSIVYTLWVIFPCLYFFHYLPLFILFPLSSLVYIFLIIFPCLQSNNFPFSVYSRPQKYHRKYWQQNLNKNLIDNKRYLMHTVNKKCCVLGQSEQEGAQGLNIHTCI